MSGYLPSEIAPEELEGMFFKKPLNPGELLTTLEQNRERGQRSACLTVQVLRTSLQHPIVWFAPFSGG